MTLRPRSRWVQERALVVALLVPVACTSASPATAPGPSASAAASAAASAPAAAWVEAQFEQSGAVTDQPSGSPPVHCSPCHSAEITLLFGVTAFSSGFVATGVEEPPAHAAAWTSIDGSSWLRVRDLPAEEGSVGVAAAADATRVVIVGRNNAGATSWASTDGKHWSVAPHSADLAGPAGATRMTGVAVANGRFVAGGFSDDPLHSTLTVAVWTSSDGLAWTRVAPSADAGFTGAHILGMASGSAGLAAVGTTHDETHGSAAAWFSTDGLTWRRAVGADLSSGIMRSVVPRGGGSAAVGLTAADNGTAAWTSGDGLTWRSIPDQEAFRFGTSPMRMLGLMADAAGLVAVGWRSDAGNGSAVMWTSADGVSWTREPFLPTFSGATASAVAATQCGSYGAATATAVEANANANQPGLPVGESDGIWKT